jgi:hypothetical protein
MSAGIIRSCRKGLAFLVSFFALVVFFVDGFFAAVVFLVAAGAFFGAATDFFAVAVLFVVVLDLPRAAFFAGAAFAGSLAFLDGGWAFCNRLNNTPLEKENHKYLFGIGSNPGALRGKLDLARRTLREYKCVFLSSASKCQVKLMKV